MNYSNLTKKLFLSLSIFGLLLNAETSKSAEWDENPEIVSCTTGHADMSDSALGADHSRPFSIVSDSEVSCFVNLPTLLVIFMNINHLSQTYFL